MEAVAHYQPKPLEYDKPLRALARQIGAGIKIVRQEYNMTLKKLNLVPLDLGLITPRKRSTRSMARRASSVIQTEISKGKIPEKWSERRDSNPRPSVPKTDALPGCATLRTIGKFHGFYMKQFEITSMSFTIK